MLQHVNPLVYVAANTEENYTTKMTMKICKHQVYGFGSLSDGSSISTEFISLKKYFIV